MIGEEGKAKKNPRGLVGRVLYIQKTLCACARLVGREAVRRRDLFRWRPDHWSDLWRECDAHQRTTTHTAGTHPGQ